MLLPTKALRTFGTCAHTLAPVALLHLGACDDQGQSRYCCCCVSSKPTTQTSTCVLPRGNVSEAWAASFTWLASIALSSTVELQGPHKHTPMVQGHAVFLLFNVRCLTRNFGWCPLLLLMAAGFAALERTFWYIRSTRLGDGATT